MAVTVNGTGIGNESTYPVMTGTITIKNTSDARARIRATQKRSSGGTKRLNYNHREISSQLMRAKKAQGAANVLTRAKSKLSVLKRSAATGQYDSREVANALAHARRMVQCAQMKVRHLKEEELEQKKHSRENRTEERQNKGEVKRRAANKERELKEKIQIETVHKVQQEKTKRQQMLQKRRTHRRQEMSKINEADMKYLKGEIENQRYQGVSSDDGVILNLSAEAAMLNEAQIRLQAEQEAEMEAAMNMESQAAIDGSQMEGSSLGTSIGTGASATNTAAGEPTTVGGSVDIVL